MNPGGVSRRGRRAAMQAVTENKIITQNRQARHDYLILASIEAGLALTGMEVKSLRGTAAAISRTASPRSGAARRSWSTATSARTTSATASATTRSAPQAAPAQEGNPAAPRRGQGEGPDPRPLQFYFTPWGQDRAALAKGKKLYDKREDAAKRDAQRRAERGED